MSDFLHFMEKTAEAKAAKNLYNYAECNLELALIKKRLAEIKSQHEPLFSLSRLEIKNRDIMYAAAFYVVVGRMPEEIDNLLKDKKNGVTK